MTHEAFLEIHCGTPQAAVTVWQAVRLELEPGIEEGDHATARIEGPLLFVNVQARDASGLRAALTGAARLCDAALRVVQGRP